jgi:protease I
MQSKKKSVGIFVENNYQELEFWYPRLRLKEAGYEVIIIGPEKKTYKSKLGYDAVADRSAEEMLHHSFDALVIPGGYAPDLMRICKPMLHLVKNTHEQGGLIAAICHAIWVPISAKIVSGRKATCYHTVKDDLINAGAEYLDQSVVVDGNLITSRKPDDLPDFCKKIIEQLR